jgi:acyl carrier protein
MPVKLNRLLAEPRSTALFEELCDDYIAASPRRRAAIREAVASNRELVSTLEHWHPPYEQEDLGRYLELKLTSISILDGRPDYRDTLLRLAAEWEAAEKRGFDPRPYFNAAARISTDEREHSAKGLIRQITRESRRNQLLRGMRTPSSQFRRSSRKTLAHRISLPVARQFDVLIKDLTDSTRFREDLGADDAALDALFDAYEEEFEITIPAGDRAAIETMGQALEYIKNRLS